jgi:L,D-transpeptidase-like protein
MSLVRSRSVKSSGSLYRIHGTSQPSTIDQRASSGCIRMLRMSSNSTTACTLAPASSCNPSPVGGLRQPLRASGKQTHARCQHAGNRRRQSGNYLSRHARIAAFALGLESGRTRSRPERKHRRRTSSFPWSLRIQSQTIHTPVALGHLCTVFNYHYRHRRYWKGGRPQLALSDPLVPNRMKTWNTIQGCALFRQKGESTFVDEWRPIC